MKTSEKNINVPIRQIGIAYILILSVLSYLLPIPEIIKAFLALPGFVIIPWLFGEVIITIFRFQSKLFKIDFISRIIVAWLIGIIGLTLIASLLYTIKLFNFYLYLILLLVCCITYAFYDDYAISVSLTNINLISFLLGEAFGISLAIIFMHDAPFPLILDLDAFRINLSILKLIEDNIVWLGAHYLPSQSLLMAISSTLFNLDSYMLFWSAVFFSYFLYFLGVYLFSYEISKDKRISLLAGIIGVSAVWTKTIALHRYIPQTIIYILFPFFLLLITKFFGQIHTYRKIEYKKEIIIYFTYVGSLFMLFNTMLINYNYSNIRSIILLSFIIVYFCIIKKLLSTPEIKTRAYILLLIFFSSLFIHISMGILLIIVAMSYVLSITYFKKSTKARITLYLWVILLVTFIIGQGVFLGIIKGCIKYTSIQTYPIDYNNPSIKLTIFLNSYTPTIVSLFLLGSIIAIFYNKDDTFYAILFMTSLVLALFCSSIDEAIFRILLFATPAISFFAAYSLIKMYNFLLLHMKFQSRKLLISYVTIIIIILIPTLISPTILILQDAKRISNRDNRIAMVDYYEYDVSKWIKSNTNENAIIISDPVSQLIITGTSKRQNVGEVWMPSSVRKSIYDIIKNKGNKLSVETLRTFIKNPLPLDVRYSEDFNKYQFSQNLENREILIIISGRTERWINRGIWGGKYEINFAEDFFPSEFKSLDIIIGFKNSEYFKEIYSINNKIYVFKFDV